MFKSKKQEEDPAKKFKEGEYSDELKKELDELHKFKITHLLWPLFSVILISIVLLFVYKNYMVKDTNSVIDRKTPEEKIKSKPTETATPEVPKEQPKAEAPKEEAKPVAPTPTTEDYTIKDGDTLGAVAELRGISSAEIINLNPGLVAENIQIGQVIKLPKKQ